MGFTAGSVALLIWGSSLSAVAMPLPDVDGVDLIRAPEVYTLTNLHPDEARLRLYATNYQQPGLIPQCAKVDLVRLTRKTLVFRVEETGRQYSYDFHSSAAEPFEAHLRRYFGTTCSGVAALSEVDRRGIRTGQAAVGMSKRGVELAIGYPPRHTTSSPELNAWLYWKNRFDRLRVVFDEHGIVTELQD